MVFTLLVNRKKYVYSRTNMLVKMEEMCPKKASEELCRLMGNISHNLRDLRKKNNLTQNDLAYLIGSDKAVISSIETRANSGVNLNTLVKISTLFDIQVKQLISD